MWPLALMAAVVSVDVASGAASATGTVESGDTFVEVAGSALEVSLTESLADAGFELQTAHSIALFATEGVLLFQDPQVCEVYLVTLFWCDPNSAGGGSANKMMRFRMDASCFDSYFPPGQACLSVQCPQGMKQLHRLSTGASYCLGIPKNACVFAQILGPVESTCTQTPDCSCLPDLDFKSCSQTVQCVPVAPTLVQGVEVPTECAQCD